MTSSIDGPSLPQLATLSAQSAAGVQSSSAPMKISARTPHCLLAGRVERSRRAEPQVAFSDERFERIGLRNGEGDQAPAEKPTTATRSGSTKLWRARKARAP